jgi:hypothetical protein
MQTLDMALIELVRRNLVTIEEAQSRTLTPNLFTSAQALDGRPQQQPQRPAQPAGRA